MAQSASFYLCSIYDTASPCLDPFFNPPPKPFQVGFDSGMIPHSNMNAKNGFDGGAYQTFQPTAITGITALPIGIQLQMGTKPWSS
jgi:hypothetical protein